MPWIDKKFYLAAKGYYAGTVSSVGLALAYERLITEYPHDAMSRALDLAKKAMVDE